MSKQSNEFQRLIKRIYETLSEKPANVSESALIKERGRECKREIDVLIEQEVSGEKILIGIECRDRSRVDDVTWIDGMIGKFIDLDLNHKIAVSSKGFSKCATDKAKAYHIKTYTLKEATDIDWGTKFIKPGLAYIKFDIQFAKYRIVMENETQDYFVAKNKKAKLKNGLIVPLDKVAEDAYKSTVEPLFLEQYKNKRPDFYKTVADLREPIQLQAQININDLVLIEENGDEKVILRIDFLSIGLPTVNTADLDHSVLHGPDVHVSDGTLEMDGKKINVNLVQRGNQTIKVRYEPEI
jgi:hypothetical protein